MTIGVWLNNNMMPQEGGAYNYIQSLVKLLDAETFDNVEVVFLTYSRNKGEPNFQKSIIYLNQHFSPNTFFLKFIRKMLKKNSSFNLFLSNVIDKAVLKVIRAHHVDFVYYLNQGEKEIALVPFISTNWDIGHLTLNQFPEFIENGQLKKRNQWYNGEIKNATVIAVESEAGKNELVNYLNIPKEKIVVIPFFISAKKNEVNPSNVLAKFGLKRDEYFYYPAQYWKHKNHSTLLKSFGEYSKIYSKKLVFSGSDKGEQTPIKKEISELQLEEKVLCLNFVSDEEKEILLKNSFGLVMPSYLGPTNLPPLEALEYDVPCACSNLLGHIEMLKESAIFFNPHAVDEIYHALIEISNEKVRLGLKKNRATVRENSVFTYNGAKESIQKMFTALNKTHR